MLKGGGENQTLLPHVVEDLLCFEDHFTKVVLELAVRRGAAAADVIINDANPHPKRTQVVFKMVGELWVPRVGDDHHRWCNFSRGTLRRLM